MPGRMEKMTELIIRYNYGRGTMQINTEEFLSMHNAAKVKKLLKIIRGSDTPEQEEVFRECVEQLLSGTDAEKRIHANAAVDWGTRATERKAELEKLQAELEKVAAYRNAYKRNSPPYKHMEEIVKGAKDKVKEQREKVRFAEGLKRDHTRDFKRVLRNEGFYKKLLSEIFNQG